MRVDSLPNLLPFNVAERPGLRKGALDTELRGLDLAGVVYRQAKPSDDLPATSSPVMNIPGLAPLQAANPVSPEARLEQHARQLVSQTFFGTMLKQMRDSPFKSDLFEGGRGGQAFSGLYDQKLAEHMSRGAGKKLVDAIVRKLSEAKKAYGKQPNRSQDERAAGRSNDQINANAATAIPADAATREATNPYQNVKINVHPDLRS